jgi:hypothetical protein
MQNFVEAVGALSEEERVKENAGIAVSWELYFTKEYRAYLELHIAARTDPQLRKVFIPRARLYDRLWRREVARAFPEWTRDMETLERADEFVRATLEGLALNSDVWDDSERQRILVQFVSDTAVALRDKKLKFPRKSRMRAMKADPV